MAELEAAVNAAKHGSKIIDLCGQEDQGKLLAGRYLMVPPECTLKNGTILLADGAQVSIILHLTRAYM